MGLDVACMTDVCLPNLSGPLVEHQYRKVGKFYVTLSASNRVDQVEATAQVDVTEPLQGKSYWPFAPLLMLLPASMAYYFRISSGCTQ